MRRKLLDLICPTCGNQFHPGIYKQRFCSGSCGAKSRTGEKAGNFKGGRINHAGYRIISVNGHRYLEHRYLMQQAIGRPLTRSEQVHHKDGNRLNNALENLELCESRQSHNARHRHLFMDATRKQCNVCLETKGRSEFYVRRNPGGRDANAPSCKSCLREFCRQRNAKAKAIRHASRLSQ